MYCHRYQVVKTESGLNAHCHKIRIKCMVVMLAKARSLASHQLKCMQAGGCAVLGSSGSATICGAQHAL